MKGIYESFGTWLDATGRSFLMTEAAKKPKAPKNDVPDDDSDIGKKIDPTTISLEKYPQYKKELEAVAGAIVYPEEGYQNPKFKGLFLKHKDSGGDQLNLSKGSQAEKDMLDAGATYETIIGSVYMRFTFSDGNFMLIRPSGKKDIAQADGSGASDARGNTTELQESITATILELNIKGFQFPTPQDKEFAKRPVTYWIINSDPVKKTGLCQYVDFSFVSDPEKFKQQMTEWLYQPKKSQKWTGWSTNFENIAKENWKARLNDVFKSKKPNWAKAIFVHDRRLIAGLNREIVAKYLRGTRCGQQKDTVDKADIVAVFDTVGNANKLLDKIYKTTDLTTHNQLLNRLVNECELVGISLKQVASNINVAAVNFDILTNAVGDNINDDYKVAVHYDTGNKAAKQKYNTFAVGAASIIPGSEDAGSFRIKLPVKVHDLHLREGQFVMCSVRNHNGINIAFQANNSKAKFGDANSLFEVYKGIGNTTKRYRDYCRKGMSPQEATRQVADDLVIFFNENPLALAEIFSKAAGYPLVKTTNGKNHDYELTQAPYIKIY